MHRDPLLTFDPEPHIYRYDGRVVPSVTQILDVVERFKYFDSIEMQEARERGTAVHLITHLYDLDDLDEESVDDYYRPYLDAYIKFKRESGFQMLESEQQIWHPDYHYAGTLDLIGTLGRDLVLIDKKTGGDYLTFGPQVAAYKNAWEKSSGRKIKARYILKLNPNGTYRLVPQNNPQDWGVFLACLTVYRFFHEKP